MDTRECQCFTVSIGPHATFLLETWRAARCLPEWIAVVAFLGRIHPPSSAWTRMFPDDRMAVAAIDGLIHQAHDKEVAGESYR